MLQTCSLLPHPGKTEGFGLCLNFYAEDPVALVAKKLLLELSSGQWATPGISDIRSIAGPCTSDPQRLAVL